MPRFFVDLALTPDAEFHLPEAAARHVQVLRLDAGDEVVLFDGDGGEYSARIVEVAKRRVTVRTSVQSHPDVEAALDITLLQGVSAAERMDYAVQKATELGVTRIIPVEMQFSQGRLSGERAAKRLAHWQGVAIAACEQSGRTRVPEILPACALEDALGHAQSVGQKLTLSPRGLAGLATLPQTTDSVALLIGPEGGLSEGEELIAARAGFVALRLGPRIMRTETAAAVAIALVQARWGDLGQI
ncbi:16S rRNA (uracil(1498)-N(3))-methyltransferase [Chitinibacteraceae bacterium HSL-7]